MSELILPNKVKFKDYKGFAISVKYFPSAKMFGGFAISQESEKKVEFTAKGYSRNECGRALEELVDIYRRQSK